MGSADHVVSAGDLRRVSAALLVAHGVPDDQADLVAENLVEADLRGIDSHGTNLLALYVGRLESGHLRPSCEVSVVRDDGSTVVLDGGLGFGQVAGRRAIDLAIERARAHGVAAVAVRESTHLGALATYTERAADAGVLAMAFQNGPTIVPPFGGLTPLMSTNPFSYAVPAGDEPPIVYDVATTTVAGNKIILAKKRGDPSIPPGWANDDQGRPTTDTAAASVHHLQWFGGHKGYGIALLVELLAGVLAGSCFGRTEQTESLLHGPDRIAKGYVFLALDVDRFVPVDRFRQQVDALIREVHAGEVADGAEAVFVPGEPEYRRRAERLRDGIPLSTALVDEINELADARGVAKLR